MKSKEVNIMSNKRKKPQAVGSVILLLVLFGVSLLSNGADDSAVILVSLAFTVLAIYAVSGAFRKAVASKKQTDGERTGASAGRPRTPATGFSSVSKNAKPEDPRMKTFTRPEAPCIVCETTGENHLERDRANRLRQLDEWLKIGLIERDEYRILKERYQRDL